MPDHEQELAISILAYMTTWCPDCLDAHKVLKRSGLPFKLVDVETVPGAETEMLAAANGVRKVPTILIERCGKRIVLIEPGADELAAALQDMKGAANTSSPV